MVCFVESEPVLAETCSNVPRNTCTRTVSSIGREQQLLGVGHLHEAPSRRSLQL